MTPPTDRELQLANSVIALSRAGERQAAATERLARSVEETNAQVELREREWLDAIRRIAAQREADAMQHNQLLTQLAVALKGMEAHLATLGRDVDHIREDSQEHDLAEIRAAEAAARELRSRNSDPPPGKIGAAALAGGWFLRQWGKQTTLAKILLIILIVMVWTFGGHQALRYLEGRRAAIEYKEGP